MQRRNKTASEIKIRKNIKLAVIVSKFNDDITRNLLEGALNILTSCEVDKSNVKIIWVPGSFEIPLACQKLARSGKYDGIIALGCVIKGKTDHYYHIAEETSRGIMRVMLENSLPIGFGIITTQNLAQARERSGTKNNKGSEAAQAVLEMLSQSF